MAYCATYIENGRKRQKKGRTADLALAGMPDGARLLGVEPSKWQGYTWKDGEKVWITGPTEQAVLNQVNDNRPIQGIEEFEETFSKYGLRLIREQLSNRRIQASVFGNEESLINTHIKGSDLDKTPLEKISFLDFQHFLNRKTDDFEKSSRGKSTVVHLHSLLRKIWRAIMSDPLWMDKVGLISFDYRNNQRAVSIDSMLLDRKEDTPFSDEEIEKIIASCSDMYDQAMVGLCLCGLRPPGELLGVKISDVDFENRELRVHGQVRCEKQPDETWKIVYKDRTKTGRRDPRRKTAIPIPERAFPLIEATRELGDDYVIPSPVHGGAMHPTTARKRWKSLLERAGVRHRRIYNTRHTVATRLIHDGADPKTVQLIGGWSDARTVLDSYVRHDTEQAAKQLKMMGVLCKATEKFEDLVSAVEKAPLEVKLKVLLHLTTQPLAG